MFGMWQSTFLLMLMALFLNGCIYIPGPELYRRSTGNGPPVNPKQLVGAAESALPIRPGVRREEVWAMLGQPHSIDLEGTLELYDYEVHCGWLFCIAPINNVWGNRNELLNRYFALLIWFDHEGRVESWRIVDKLGPLASTLRRFRDRDRDIE